METSLHQQLKSHYATSSDQIEVVIGAYRIDVVRDSELIEIQCASLSAIRKKVIDLLRRHDVRVVKPTVNRTRICKRNVSNGPVISRRLSPKCGAVHDIFEELIYLRGVFPNPRLTIEIPTIDVNQYRWMRKRKTRRRRDPGYVIEDTELVDVHSTVELNEPSDLWQLLPGEAVSKLFDQASDSSGVFNTNDLADAVGCARWIAQRIAYVLRHCHAIEPIGRDRTGIRYRIPVQHAILV
ncbi:hypothetical protein [Neorhodopirellula pilleata]|uniref:DUF8091 domain-containing protein n=1 Tax=Neorhodopirellula pilleata TaxID=2714738 RepID=A0A5C6A3L2_9BACT|nr:hypothetical protein [Neorhodopirellula pilleata]TWT93003.1 hypothetical protein Pla100_43190 [Neorhodopirellula pilleata]